MILGDVVKISPTFWGLLVVITLKTPGGKPAFSAKKARANAESGVSSDGFKTTVQPTANAGATLRVIIAIGKFQGVIAATTPIDMEVVEEMHRINKNNFGNPSSIHQFGQKSRSIIEKSRRQISKSLNCKPNEIIFTSGGSESNNLVLQGFLKKCFQKSRKSGTATFTSAALRCALIT